jgi:hypothetical protein
MQANEPNEDPVEPLSAPSGPFPEHVDEASGGADSSPFESLSSDERHEALQAAEEEHAKRVRVTHDGCPD